MHTWQKWVVVACGMVMCTILVALATDAGTITGRVTDKATGKPLVYAVVEIESLGIRAVADSAGIYKLANVPAGSHTLKVSFWGMEIITDKVTLREGESRALNFQMAQTLSKTAKPEAGREFRLDLRAPSQGDINLNSLNQQSRTSAYRAVPQTIPYPPNIDT